MSATVDIQVPLHSLIVMLRAEGYEIGTSALLDLQRIIANVKSTDVHSLTDLKYLISPVICRNKEEQQKFYKLFDEYLLAVSKRPVVIDESSKRSTVKNKKRLIWLIAAACLVTISIVASWLFFTSIPKRVTSGIYEYHNGNKITLPGDTVQLGVNYMDGATDNAYTTNWQLSGPDHFSQSFKAQKSIALVLDSAGQYTAIASTYNKGGKLLQHDTALVDVLCETPPSVNIIEEPSASPSRTFKAITNYPADSGYRYHWFINDSAVKGDSIMQTAGLQPHTAYIIRVRLDWENKGLHCSTDTLGATFAVIPPLQLSVAEQSGSPLVLRKNYHWSNIALSMVVLLLLPLLAAGGILWQRRKAAKKEQHTTVTGNEQPDETKGKEYKGPFIIEFDSQQNKILPEAGISQLAEVLRKRQTSDVCLLNIRKTINSTIRKGGFPVLEYTPRTQPADFLILIDKAHPDGHLTKLFTYVTERLKKDQVNLTVYSFSGEPLLLSNESLNHILLPIDKIARLYPKTMLIIFSQADAFFRSYDIILKKWVTEKFKSWDTKLIITPIAKKDWDAKELALYDAGFTVVPADINAHSIISNEINHMIDRQMLKKEIVPDAYSSRQFNFNRWRQVSAYLAKAVKENRDHLNDTTDITLLEQWLCALAVYPHIDWDVTIAMGKALEDKYGKPGALVNYTNLLVLSRIQWMNDGQLMDSMRVEMLNKLTEENQALARAVIVELLKAIEPQLQEDSMIKEEIQFLQTTNKFLLNAYDKESNSLTAEELEQFKKYAANGQLDWTLEQHLEIGNNTLLKNGNNTKYRISLEEYLNNQNTETTNRQPAQKTALPLKKWLPVIAAMLVIIMGYLALSITGKLQWNLQQSYADIRFNQDTTSLAQPVNSLAVLLNDSTYEATDLDAGSFAVNNLPVSDSVKQATLQVDINGIAYTALFNLNNSDYKYSIKAGTAATREAPSNTPSDSTINLPQAVNEIWNVKGDAMVAFYLKQKLFIALSKGNTRATQYKIVAADSIGNNTYRIIIQLEAGKSYQALFIRNVTATSLNWQRCSANTYSSISDARKATPADCNVGFDVVNVKYNSVVSTATTLSKPVAIKIELPVNTVSPNGVALRNFQVAQSLFATLSGAQKATCTAAISINGFYKFDADVQQRQQAILNSAIRKSFRQANWVYKPFNGTAFDRDFIEISFPAMPTDTEDNSPLCDRIFYSVKEASSVAPARVCKLDLSNQNLTSIPKEVFAYTNIQQLTLTGNNIDENEVQNFKNSFPKCDVVMETTPPYSQKAMPEEVVRYNFSFADYSKDSYAQTIALKADVLNLIDKSAEPYTSHQKEATQVLSNINQVIEYEKGLAGNSLTVQQWNAMLDATGEKGILGSYIALWKKNGALSTTVMNESRQQISQGFDAIAKLKAPTKARPKSSKSAKY